MRPSLPAGLVRLGAPLPAHLHPEAALLTACLRAGLPVPTGAVLLDGRTDLGPLRPGDHVRLRVLGSPTGIRVATGGDVASAVVEARAYAPTGHRADLLVLRAVPSVHAGTARTQTGRPDLVRAVEGEPDELLTGEVRELAMPRLERAWTRAHRGCDEWRTPLPPWGMRLSGLLRRVRRTVGLAPLVVTWADDGHRCRLLGVGAD